MSKVYIVIGCCDTEEWNVKAFADEQAAEAYAIECDNDAEKIREATEDNLCLEPQMLEDIGAGSTLDPQMRLSSDSVTIYEYEELELVEAGAA